MSTQPGLTVADLADYPQDDGNRYELIDGELRVTTQPHEQHQFIVANLIAELVLWNRQTNSGRVYAAPGVVFAPGDAVAPDVVWVRRARLPALRHADGKLHGAPDLVVEVLSPGAENEQRDRQTKHALYARYGVAEYWIVDRFGQQVAVYRRAGADLPLAQTVTAAEELTSPLLPGFACRVAALFEAE